MRVLIVEDEVRLAETLARGLRRHAMAVDVAHDGSAGRDKALVNDYDVVVLDRDLPLVHGDDVCRQLRAAGRAARILMLTAAATVEDLVSGLDLGADDYLAKPFDFAELRARIHALERRAPHVSPAVLHFADVELDPARLTVTRGGRPVDLTPREHAVLELLLRAEGAPVTAEELLEKAWDEHADPLTTAVRVIVSRLRSKLGEPPLIETLLTKGYRLRAEE
ncbi:MAG TPA: response regulator transcription factor [Acidimicrobiales bacterium]